MENLLRRSVLENLKLETWEQWESDREKYVISHKQNEMSFPKIDKNIFYSDL